MSSRRTADEVLRAGAPAFREFLTAVMLHGQAAADAVGLGPTDFYGLNLLGLGSMTAGELSDHTGLTTGATTRLIDRLEQAGYVRRTPDPADRRKVRIEAVPDHGARIAEALEPARRHLAEVFQSYTPEQLAVLFDFFARAVPAFRAAATDARDRG